MTATRAVRSRGTPKNVASYLGAPYVRMLIPNTEEGGYLAEVLELPGCISEGDTPEDAYRNLDDAMAGWIGASLDSNRPIPEPVGAKEYSGNFPLRISTDLHRAAALRAIQEGVSLNQWIARAIAAQVTKEYFVDLADEVAKRVAQQILIDVEDVNLSIRRLRVGVSQDDFAPAVVEPAEVSVADTNIASLLTIREAVFVRQYFEKIKKGVEEVSATRATSRKEVSENA